VDERQVGRDDDGAGFVLFVDVLKEEVGLPFVKFDTNELVDDQETDGTDDALKIVFETSAPLARSGSRRSKFPYASEGGLRLSGSRGGTWKRLIDQRVSAACSHADRKR